MSYLNHSSKIIKLAIPVALANLLSLFTSIIGMMLVAHLGAKELAASALLYSTQVTLTVTAMGTLFSVGVVAGRAYGAQQFLEIGAVVRQGWLLALLISVPTMLVMWFIKAILLALHQNVVLLDLVESYFHAYLLAVPAFLGTACNNQFLLAILHRRTVTLITLIGFLLNTLLAYGLIYGKWGLPALDMAGLGYAFAIQAWCIFIGVLFYFYNSKKFEKYNLFQWDKIVNFALLKKLFTIGWPISIQMVAELLAFFVLMLMAGWVGAVALSARQIALQYLMILVMIVFSITQAASILIGHMMGARNYAEIKSLGNNAVIIALLISLFGFIVFITMPKLLASAFVDIHNPQNFPLVHLVSALLLIMGIGQFFDAARNVMTGALRGLFDTRFPMIASLICLWVIALPLGYFFAFNLHQGVIGIATAFNITLVLGALVIGWRWHTRLPEMLVNV